MVSYTCSKCSRKYVQRRGVLDGNAIEYFYGVYLTEINHYKSFHFYQLIYCIYLNK